MKLIIGLGNPGEKFEETRHNVGFLTVDAISKKMSCSTFNLQQKFNAEISQGIINNEKIILLKPQTFMNTSGESVRNIIDYYKINPENIIVIQDDLDIFLGKYKISTNKNSGGHKGIQSIIDCLETKNFTRSRIGIMIENKKTPTEKFVLEKFSKNEMIIIEEVIEKIVKEVLVLLKQ